MLSFLFVRDLRLERNVCCLFEQVYNRRFDQTRAQIMYAH